MPRYEQIEADGPYAYRFRMTEDYLSDRAYYEVDLFRDVRRWCKEQFGDTHCPPGTPRVRAAWRVSATTVKFMNEDAAFAFRMRWC